MWQELKDFFNEDDVVMSSTAKKILFVVLCIYAAFWGALLGV